MEVIAAMVYFPFACRAGQPISPSRLGPSRVFNVTTDTKMCGPNSLYLILKLYHLRTDKSIIRRYAPTSPDGMSILELQTACEANGLSTEVRSCTVATMCAHLTSPVIAYVSSQSGKGHYIILLAARGNEVDVIDSSTGDFYHSTPSLLQHVWRGYVIVPTPAKKTTSEVLWGSTIIWFLVGVISLLIPGRARGDAGQLAFGLTSVAKKLSVRITGVLRCSMLILAFALSSLTAPSETSGSQSQANGKDKYVIPKPVDGAWRVTTNDGLNCLFLQLRTLGYRGNYGDFCKRAAACHTTRDLASLARLSEDVGYPVSPRELTTSELGHLGRPAVIFIEHHGIGSGTFWLYLNGDEGYVRVVGGPPMTWAEVSREEFERSWTRYALVPDPSHRGTMFLLRCTTGLVVLGAIAYFQLRNLKRPLLTPS